MSNPDKCARSFKNCAFANILVGTIVLTAVAPVPSVAQAQLDSVINRHAYAIYALVQFSVFGCGSGYVGLNALVAHPDAAVVFVGRVVSVEDVGAALAQAVTFNVDRVWKGAVKTRTVIYQILPVGRRGERRLFQPGKQFLVVAHRLNTSDGRDLGIADNEDVFGTDACADGSDPVSVLRHDAGSIGPGSTPVDQPVPRRGFPKVAQPIKIRDATPAYSDDARAAGVRGSVILEIQLDVTGKVTHASVLRSISLVDQAAIDCVMKWEFLPALIDGIPQPFHMVVYVTFPPGGQ